MDRYHPYLLLFVEMYIYLLLNFRLLLYFQMYLLQKHYILITSKATKDKQPLRNVHGRSTGAELFGESGCSFRPTKALAAILRTLIDRATYSW